MDAGYDPGRVHSLTRHTLESIDRLDALTSSDPAAADALRTVRLTRANLEDHWMHALRDLERSAPMTRWRASNLTPFGFRSLGSMGQSLPDHLRPGGLSPVAIPEKRRAELLGQLDWLERRAINGDDERRVNPDVPVSPGAPTQQELEDLADDIAYWVRRDDDFATDLVELSTSNMTVARLLGVGSFPSAFSARVVKQMAMPNGPDSGIDRDRYARSLGLAVASLVGDPGACLDLLLDEPTTYALAAWEELDSTMLADFVASGLMDSVLADATRLADGFEVIGHLTLAANGPLDDGMSAGMARGLALSMPVYFPLLSGGVFQTGDNAVRISEHRITLGTYDEVARLFGSVMRDDEAAGALGVSLGTFTHDELTRDGLDLADAGSLTDVVNLSVLLDDAAQTEQAQVVMEAAAEEARRRQLAGWFGTGTNIALLASGVGAAWRSAASAAIRTITDGLDDVEPARFEGASIAARQYEQIWRSAMANALERPATRQAAQRDPVVHAQVEEFRRRLDEIEACDDPFERSVLVSDLRTATEGTIVDDYMDRVVASNGLESIR